MKKLIYAVLILLVVSMINSADAGTYTFTKKYIPLNDGANVVKTKTTSTDKIGAGYRKSENELRTLKRIYTYVYEDSTSSLLAPMLSTLEVKTGNTITMTTNDYYEDENSNSGLDVRIKYKDSNGGIGIGYYSDGKINYY